LSGKCSFIVAAALCLSWSAANAQGEPVKYWIPFGPFGYGGGTAATADMESYGSVPAFDAAQTEKSGFVFRSYSAPVSSLTGFGWNGVGPTAFGSSLSYERSQFGYNFKGVGDMPMTLFGGVDTLKYNPDVFSNIMSFSPNSGPAPAYGVEPQPVVLGRLHAAAVGLRRYRHPVVPPAERTRRTALAVAAALPPLPWFRRSSARRGNRLRSSPSPHRA
jgi:hypothetical protein